MAVADGAQTMGDFLRWLAQWRGIDVEPGSELQFEFANFPTGGLGLLVLMGMAWIVVLVGFVYRRDGRNLSLWRRTVLATLRTLAVLAVVVLLLEPNLVTVKRETRVGHTILLVDTSQSMTHVDAWRRDEVQNTADAWRAVGAGDPKGATRIELVKALLAYEDQAIVRKLAAKNEVQLYGFAGSIADLPLVASEEPLPKLDLEQLVADGRASNLGGALRTALDKSRPAEIAAVVFVTDGRRTAGPQGPEIARLLEQRKIPHTFVLGVGDPSETQTVTLTRIEAPAKTPQLDKFQIKATVTTQGYDGLNVTARLVRSDEQGSEVVVGTQQVHIGERQTAEILWSDLSSDVPGRFVYRAEIDPPAGEPLLPERHSKSAVVEVLDKRLRVLLLAGGASHEFQILRRLLLRDKTIDVSCWLLSADEKFPQDGNDGVRLDRLPEERAEFDVYDVVIAIDPDPAKLSRRFCEHLASHIVEGGCGFWWVAGEKFTLEALRATATTRPIADLLPIVPDVEFAERKMIGFGKAFKYPWRYRLTPDGEAGVGAKVMRLDDDRDTSKLLWERLPGFHFWFPVSRLKPAAVSLAGHPSPEFRVAGKDMPVIALQSIGAGRVLFLGTDETYRWRSLYEDAYNRFWVNGIRYLFEGRLLAGNSRLRILASDDKIDLGGAIELTAIVKDEVLQPLIVESFPVSIEREGGDAETVALGPVEAQPGSYSLRFRPTKLGTYRVRPLEKIGKPVEVSFQVVPAQVEAEGPMDRAELAA
ncbi:MAG TPA: VWA domain-containing protein, partial [bacterium]|nr:VWA domain-containing protein [bacterium]